MIFSWWTAILAALGIGEKVAEGAKTAAEDKRASDDLATSARNVEEADAVAASLPPLSADTPTPPESPAARRVGG